MNKSVLCVLVILLFLLVSCAEQASEQKIIPKEAYTEIIKPEAPQYENECLKEGLRQCIGNEFQVCGYYDQDPTLDWSSPNKCPEESYCQEGQCFRRDIQKEITSIIPQQPAEPQQIAPQITISQSGCQTNLDCDDHNAATIDKCSLETRHCIYDTYRICQNDVDCNYRDIGFFAHCYNLGEISACLGCSTNADCKLGYCNKDIPNRRRCVSKLKGSINVGIIEFKLSDTKFNNLFYCKEGNFRVLRSPVCLDNSELIEKHNFLDLFNDIDGERTFETVAGKQRALSVYYIPTYLKNQAKKYGVTDLTINTEVKGPFNITKTFPESEVTTPIGRPVNPYLFEFFEEQINERKVDISKYDLVFVLFFDDWDISDRGRSTDQFTSTVNYPYVFIDTRTSITPGISDQTIQTMTHEFLHLFEAKDKYIEPCSRGNYWSCCKDPDGLAEPNKIPKYPQTKACLMCGSIPLKEDGESKGPQNIFEVDICDKTAEEIGWK